VADSGVEEAVADLVAAMDLVAAEEAGRAEGEAVG
jgi:hypothetical protein